MRTRDKTIRRRGEALVSGPGLVINGQSVAIGWGRRRCTDFTVSVWVVVVSVRGRDEVLGRRYGRFDETLVLGRETHEFSTHGHRFTDRRHCLCSMAET